MGVRRIVQKWLRSAWFDRRPHVFHFIHIPKNGGVAVRHTLALRGDVSLSKPYHYRYVDIAESVGRDLRFFCVVRNPWSRTASRFMFGKQKMLQWPESDPRRRYMEQATFESFVKEQRILPNPKHPGQPWMGPLNSWFNQLEWIRDEHGAAACDCLRLERIDDDLSTYFGRDMQVQKMNSTKCRYSYRDMYTDQLTQIVADTFQEDIDYFGFNFDGPATRNTVVR